MLETSKKRCLTVGRRSHDLPPLMRDHWATFLKIFLNCLIRRKNCFESQRTVAWLSGYFATVFVSYGFTYAIAYVIYLVFDLTFAGGTPTLKFVTWWYNENKGWKPLQSNSKWPTLNNDYTNGLCLPGSSPYRAVVSMGIGASFGDRMPFLALASLGLRRLRNLESSSMNENVTEMEKELLGEGFRPVVPNLWPAGQKWPARPQKVALGLLKNFKNICATTAKLPIWLGRPVDSF